MVGAGGRDAPRHVLAWDAVVRVLHWALAATVVFDLVHDDGDRLHRNVGYVAVAIVALRLAWAAFAPGSGGLAALKPSLRATHSFCRALLRGQPPRGPGHDPLGLWMVWLLWGLVLLLGLTGWMSRLDAFWGDDTVHDVHMWLADALLAAVCVHVIAVLAMSWLWRENLPRAMVSGRKRPFEAARDD